MVTLSCSTLAQIAGSLQEHNSGRGRLSLWALRLSGKREGPVGSLLNGCICEALHERELGSKMGVKDAPPPTTPILGPPKTSSRRLRRIVPKSESQVRVVHVKRVQRQLRSSSATPHLDIESQASHPCTVHMLVLPGRLHTARFPRDTACPRR
ncbi:hypothetical protein BDW67DRAFT_153167 [Aspergillus spinulosporus]